MDTESSQEDRLQQALGTTERLLSSQIKALEILTNICCPSDADSLDDEFYQDDSCSEDGSVIGGGIEECALELNPELKAAFLQAGLFQAVIDRAKLPAANIVEAISQHSDGTSLFYKIYYLAIAIYFVCLSPLLGKMLLKRYETLQCRAFLCLSNMVSTLDIEEMGGSKQLFDIWCGLAVLAFENSNNSDQVLEAATSSMRAIIHKLARHQDDIVQLLKMEEIALLCQRTTQCQHDQSKVNLLQVVLFTRKLISTAKV